MKIAILTNESTMNKCTGSGCLKALANKSDAFAMYEGDIELMGFTHIGGDLEKKIEKLRTEEVECVHVSTCARAGLENYSEVCEYLSRYFDVVGYSHGGKISKKGIEAICIKRNP